MALHRHHTSAQCTGTPPNRWHFMGDIYWNFCNDDVITVTSLVLTTQSVSAVFCPAVFFMTGARCK